MQTENQSSKPETELKEETGEGCSGATCSALDAGSVTPGPERYEVTYTHDHKTLKHGDVVVMSETPSMENVLIRVSDMTIHGLRGYADQYVHLLPNKHISNK